MFVSLITITGLKATDTAKYANEHISIKQIEKFVGKKRELLHQTTSANFASDYDNTVPITVNFERYTDKKGFIFKQSIKYSYIVSGEEVCVVMTYYFKDNILVKAISEEFRSKELVNRIVIYMVDYKKLEFFVNGESKKFSKEDAQLAIESIKTGIFMLSVYFSK